MTVMPFHIRHLVPALAVAVLSGAETAAPAPTVPSSEFALITESLTKGTVSASARYRWEHVEQQMVSPVDKYADASTLRVTLGYETKAYHGLSVFGEFEGVYAVGQQLYNSPNAPLAQYPRVNDPIGTELNQGYLKYVVPEIPGKITAKVGRFEYLLNNQRLVGNVGWRQNHQSFEGASIAATPFANEASSLDLTYAYLNKVNRIFGEDSVTTAAFKNPGRVDMHTHVANGTFTMKGKGSVSVYAVLLGFDENLIDPNANLAAQSSKTYGVRVAGPFAIDKTWKAIYAAEFAQQSEYRDNTTNYTADYALLEGGLGYKTSSAVLGWNQLQGSSATDKFSTPLATGHAFNGWADEFLTTPNKGLSAISLTLSSGVPAIDGLSLMAVGYRFKSQEDSLELGRELDLRAEYQMLPVDKNWLVGLKFARFIGDDDTEAVLGKANDGVTKVWAYTQYAF